jgi:hypothetical protein
MSARKEKKYYKVTIRASIIDTDEETYTISAESLGEAIKQAMSEFEEGRIIDDSGSVDVEVEI